MIKQQINQDSQIKENSTKVNNQIYPKSCSRLKRKNTSDIIMKTIKEEMDIDMREEDLDRTHHVGNPKVSKEGKPSPVIIEFTSYYL